MQVTAVSGNKIGSHGPNMGQPIAALATQPRGSSLADAIRAGAQGHTPGAPAQGWLVPRRGDGVHISAQCVGLLVASALPGEWSMHSLRHRMASRAYRGSRNLRAVQVLLGHSSISTTERYLAVDDSEIRAAMVAAVGD